MSNNNFSMPKHKMLSSVWFDGREMMGTERKSRDRLLSKKAKRFLIKELTVIVILGFVFLGASSFCKLIADLFLFVPSSFNWGLLAWIAAIYTLPKSYMKFQRSNAPYVVKLIKAFSDGVKSPVQLVPTISKLSSGILNLLRRINEF
ncbi:MAG: hypothetical protein H6656_10025 [Ardenticatenaceae bacterium]|nr:hypothetical protein [Ardenticatenaceae bacterium]